MLKTGLQTNVSYPTGNRRGWDPEWDEEFPNIGRGPFKRNVSQIRIPKQAVMNFKQPMPDAWFDKKRILDRDYSRNEQIMNGRNDQGAGRIPVGPGLGLGYHQQSRNTLNETYQERPIPGAYAQNKQNLTGGELRGGTDLVSFNNARGNAFTSHKTLAAGPGLGGVLPGGTDFTKFNGKSEWMVNKPKKLAQGRARAGPTAFGGDFTKASQYRKGQKKRAVATQLIGNGYSPG
jgi:hypothetical protein